MTLVELGTVPPVRSRVEGEGTLWRRGVLDLPGLFAGGAVRPGVDPLGRFMPFPVPDVDDVLTERRSRSSTLPSSRSLSRPVFVFEDSPVRDTCGAGLPCR